MAFKHIKRPEEVPPRPKPRILETHTERKPFYSEDRGYVRLLVSNRMRSELSEEKYHDYVFRQAVELGYRGSMYEFFCRADVVTERDYEHDAMAYCWYDYRKKLKKNAV